MLAKTSKAVSRLKNSAEALLAYLSAYSQGWSVGEQGGFFYVLLNSLGVVLLEMISLKSTQCQPTLVTFVLISMQSKGAQISTI